MGCKRCGQGFVPGAQADSPCYWHVGTYVRTRERARHTEDEEGEEMPADLGRPQMHSIEEQKVRQAIKANNRKKKSRQKAALGLLTSTGDVDAEQWSWSCCGSVNLVAPGCRSGPHT